MRFNTCDEESLETFVAEQILPVLEDAGVKDWDGYDDAVAPLLDDSPGAVVAALLSRGRLDQWPALPAAVLRYESSCLTRWQNDEDAEVPTYADWTESGEH